MTSNTQHYHILVAEDEPVNQKLISVILEQKNIKVTIADNGRVALEALEKWDIDLVLMDSFMPEMDGIEATKAIRSLDDPAKRDVPIIALTADALHDSEAKYRDAGMNDYISKPIDINSLITTISKYLDLNG